MLHEKAGLRENSKWPYDSKAVFLQTGKKLDFKNINLVSR
jgi:hypothetical protein